MSDSSLHIWLLKIPEDFFSQHLSILKKKLSPDEQKRLEGMGSEERQKEYILSHWLLRSKVSQILGLKPSDLPLSFPVDGAPKMEGGKYFASLTHTQGFVATTLSDTPVGIDVEVVKERPQMDGIAKKYFSAREVEEINELHPEERLKRFSELWTLKEAYFKASGLSQSDVAEGTDFEIGKNRAEGTGWTEAKNRCETNPKTPWQFLLFYPDSSTVLALAVKTSEKINPQIEKVLFSDLITS